MQAQKQANYQLIKNKEQLKNLMQSKNKFRTYLKF